MNRSPHRSRIPFGTYRASLCGVLAALTLSATFPAVAGTAEGIAAFEAGDYERAYAELKPEAEAGDAKAQLYIGRMHTYGYSRSQDAELAFYWYMKAAQAGSAEAQAIVGYAYDQGIGVAVDDVKAVEWYQEAATQEYVSAQRNLGLMYSEGEGVERDYEQAASWFRKAAEQGDAVAQTELGQQYWMSRGVDKDIRQALSWLRRGAEQDYARAQYLYCANYMSLHPPKSADRIDGMMWCKLSADQGYPGGEQLWDAATRWFVTPEQKAQAAELARQWRAEQE